MRTIDLHTLFGGVVQAVDGEVGPVYDIYFTDDDWRVKYFVVQTGEYFKGRRLLVKPAAMSVVDAKPAILTVPSTRHKIMDSPEFDEIEPVSVQRERELHPYFLWFPLLTMGKTVLRPLGASEEQMSGQVPGSIKAHYPDLFHAGNPHLHSLREVLKYEIRCVDRAAGRVEDFVAKEANWEITYVRIAVRAGLHFYHTILPVGDVEKIHWGGAQLRLAMPSEDLQHYAMAAQNTEQPRSSTMDDTLIMRR